MSAVRNGREAKLSAVSGEPVEVSFAQNKSCVCSGFRPALETHENFADVPNSLSAPRQIRKEGWQSVRASSDRAAVASSQRGHQQFHITIARREINTRSRA